MPEAEAPVSPESPFAALIFAFSEIIENAYFFSCHFSLAACLLEQFQEIPLSCCIAS
jgi:hypothetical protein